MEAKTYALVQTDFYCLTDADPAGRWFLYFALRSTLPAYEGELPAEVRQQVEISRDAQGYASIKGQNRNDVAYALGFVHAQERFFQMDLLRRNAAGELSELFGEMALDLDKKRRIHRFRAKAQRGFAKLPADQKQLLQRYTAGVNAGLAALGWPPFEYALLAQTPRSWVEADSFLALYSMYLDLQGSEGKDELAMGLMQQKLPQDWYDFLFQHSPDWQAAMDNSKVKLTPMPKSTYPALLAGQKQPASIVPCMTVLISAAIILLCPVKEPKMAALFWPTICI